MTRRHVAIAQGVFYVLTGVWPLVSIRTFERVTGPKTDDWLVRTVGLLAAVIGGVQLLRAVRAPRSPDRLLGVSAASAFAATDLVHVARREISPIYLADAVAEMAIAAGWAVARPADDRNAHEMPAG